MFHTSKQLCKVWQTLKCETLSQCLHHDLNQNWCSDILGILSSCLIFGAKQPVLCDMGTSCHHLWSAAWFKCHVSFYSKWFLLLYSCNALNCDTSCARSQVQVASGLGGIFKNIFHWFIQLSRGEMCLVHNHQWMYNSSKMPLCQWALTFRFFWWILKILKNPLLLCLFLRFGKYRGEKNNSGYKEHSWETQEHLFPMATRWQLSVSESLIFPVAQGKKAWCCLSIYPVEGTGRAGTVSRPDRLSHDLQHVGFWTSEPYSVEYFSSRACKHLSNELKKTDMNDKGGGRFAKSLIFLSSYRDSCFLKGCTKSGYGYEFIYFFLSRRNLRRITSGRTPRPSQLLGMDPCLSRNLSRSLDTLKSKSLVSALKLFLFLHLSLFFCLYTYVNWSSFIEMGDKPKKSLISGAVLREGRGLDKWTMSQYDLLSVQDPPATVSLL